MQATLWPLFNHCAMAMPSLARKVHGFGAIVRETALIATFDDDRSGAYSQTSTINPRSCSHSCAAILLVEHRV